MKTTTQASVSLLLAFVLTVPALGQEESENAAMEMVVEELLAAARSEALDVQVVALEALAITKSSSPMLIEQIQASLISPNEQVRKAAYTVLNEQVWTDSIKVEMLLEVIKSEDDKSDVGSESLAEEAMWHLTNERFVSCLPQIMSACKSTQTAGLAKARLLSLAARYRIDPESILEISRQVYVDANHYARLQILDAIGAYGEMAAPALEFLAAQVASENLDVKMAAIKTTARVVHAMQERDFVAKQVESYFKRFDENSDGKLLETEADRIIANMGGSVDQNQDMMVTREELRNVLARQRSEQETIRRRRTGIAQPSSARRATTRRPTSRRNTTRRATGR